MNLYSFSIKNYRSIFNIDNMVLSSSLTTFIGKNNRGKSNILKALSLLFQAIELHSSEDNLVHSFLRKDIGYVWEKDFPMQLRDKKNIQETIIKATLHLTKEDKAECMQYIGASISSPVIIELSFNKYNKLNISVTSPRIKKEILNKENIKRKIFQWIIGKISFQYIPAIRTAQLANEIANNIISLELSRLAPQKRESLENALKEIDKLQKPILEQIEKNLSETIKEFAPEITNISLKEQKQSYFTSPRSYIDSAKFYVGIDDGSETSLSQKGDGIKSLVTLGMMRQKGISAIGKGLILAIEEPESHLHPEAIRQISVVINDISKNNQVIVTSHSPLFVNRNNISDNIIVADNTASKAKNIKEIRETLGCIASDNLISAEFVIVVEGETDKIILEKYLRSKSELIDKWIKDKRLGFEVINGVYNLEHSLNKLMNMSSRYFCILDSDQTSKSYVTNAKAKSLLSSNRGDVSYYTLEGLNECELEDMIKPDLYAGYIQEQTGVDIISCDKFKRNRDKWSARVRDSLYSKGKIYDDSEWNKMLNEYKKYICNTNKPIDEILNLNREPSIKCFPKQIENYFSVK